MNSEGLSSLLCRLPEASSSILQRRLSPAATSSHSARKAAAHRQSRRVCLSTKSTRSRPPLCSLGYSRTRVLVAVRLSPGRRGSSANSLSQQTASTSLCPCTTKRLVLPPRAAARGVTLSRKSLAAALSPSAQLCSARTRGSALAWTLSALVRPRT